MRSIVSSTQKASPQQQVISPGRFEKLYADRCDQLRQDRAIARIWSRDANLWKPNDPAAAAVVANRLGWIPVLDTMRAESAAIAEFARQVQAAGIRFIVLLGMGGSSLAPEVFSLTCRGAADGRKFFVLDSTDPASVLEIERAVDLRHTLFVSASKSGQTIETLSQTLYFQSRLEQSGVKPSGAHFIAITDPGSYLEQFARDNGFRRAFLNPVDIGGRYSALSYFGLVPAALWGVSVSDVLDRAVAMRAACGPDAASGPNPALELGALLGAAALAKSDKLILLSTPRLVPLGNWIEQLIAESTGKELKGIVPVAGGVAPSLDVMAEGCVVAALRLAGDDSAALDATTAELKKRGAPVVEILLGREEDLGGEFFKWEVATSIAGAVLGIDPFDEPNVAESKANTARILKDFESSGALPSGKPSLTAAGVVAFAGGATPGTIAAADLVTMLGTFLGELKRGDYLSVLAYLPRDAATEKALDAFRAALSRKLPVPVLLGFGPRYMHSIGQLYKGGPPTGRFLFLTSEHAEDVQVPKAKYTFGQLQTAQALGDLESLAKRSKPALRLHFANGLTDGLAALAKLAEKALGS
jgi:glucose-6-phosphate isomerase